MVGVDEVGGRNISASEARENGGAGVLTITDCEGITACPVVRNGLENQCEGRAEGGSGSGQGGGRCIEVRRLSTSFKRDSKRTIDEARSSKVADICSSFQLSKAGGATLLDAIVVDVPTPDD